MKAHFIPKDFEALMFGDQEDLSGDGPPQPPENKLLVAIIGRAIEDAITKAVYAPTLKDFPFRDKEGAIEWIFEVSNSDRLEPFSFEWSCLLLSFCPHTIRMEVERRIRGFQ